MLEHAPAGSDDSCAVEGRQYIRIRGARVHNLKNVDVDIPRQCFVVVTGPSGSGKSSLAFDTVFAEGRRQYIESLSLRARQFLHQLERPDVDLVEGLQPTVCIDQRPSNANPRSTVATVTEIYDYLRLIMARLGTASCYRCGAEIHQQSAEQIRECLLQFPEGTKTMIMAPIVRGRRGQHREVFARIRKAGFVRARVDGQVYDIDQVPELDARKMHHIDAVVDRLIIRPDVRGRLGEAVDLAMRYSDGLVLACSLDASQAELAPGDGRWRDQLFSSQYACPQCGISYEELEPRTFSFNSSYGACPECEGIGAREEFDPELVIPDYELSLAGGAVAAWKGASAAVMRRVRSEIEAHWQSRKFGWETPLSRLRPQTLEVLLRGDGKKFPGVFLMLQRELATTTSLARQRQLEAFRGVVVCPACHGTRLRPEATSVRLGGRAIHEITALTVSQAGQFFRGLEFAESDQAVSGPLVNQIDKRLDFLCRVGVDYVTLDRPADTLSGGELQRVRLATSIGSGLVGVCYVLDEPSIGLHQRDNQRLIEALRELQSQGNTVLVVEHDESMMRQADLLIDVGPRAGEGGGRIVALGTPARVAKNAQSVTGQFLAGDRIIPVPARRRRLSKSRAIVIDGVSTNNLKNVCARFPLGALVCVTGVSGSGKSSLVNETLVRALMRRLGDVAAKPGPHTSLRGASQIDKIIEIDQSPIGRTPRSNAATYTGAFDEIRKTFAATRDAKQRGFRANRFSFNAKHGRCEHCQGQGVQKIEMNFLPDLYVTCSECEGARFNPQTLEVRYRGKTIADVLAMSVTEAVEFFVNLAHIQRLMVSLNDVGLGYLPLGQPSTTMSGGEAQRVKLATQLARVDTGKTLYVLDEPTTGLHFQDIKVLLDVLARLVERGNSVIVIEHNLDVIKCADWIIDLGPDGGENGGQIIASGTPEQLAALENNSTGSFLRLVISR